MTDILAVFRSRSQAVDCHSRLRQNGINAMLINTPKEAGVGCGLSVKIPNSVSARAKALVLSGRYSALYGFYAMKTVYGRTFYGRL